MPDVRAQLIISARDEATATMKSVGGATKDTGVSMMDLYAGVRLAEMGLKTFASAAKAAYEDTIGAATGLEQETRKLQFETGGTAEQAGKLAYVADITGVGVTKLSTAINIATRALQSHKSLGIEPNIDGLAKLSDMYNQIQDPIQRNAFLLHEFGRSGADMAPLMQLGADGIRALGDQASLTGNVLSQSATDQLHAYDMQVSQLTIDAKGMGVALGVELAPAAQRVVDGGLNLIHTFDAIKAAQQDGIITSGQATAYYVGVGTGLMSMKNVYDLLTPKVQEFNTNMAQTTDASDRAAAATKHLADVANFDGIPATSAMVKASEDEAKALDWQATIITGLPSKFDLLTDRNKATAITQAELVQSTRDTAMAQYELSTGMSGGLTKSMDTYGQTVEADAPKLAKLNAELANYEEAQGKAYTATTDSKYSLDQIDLANNKVQIAEERSTIATQKLAMAHQGAKESAAAYQVRLEGLQVALQVAGDNWQSAQIAVDKMAKGMGSSTSGIADYTTKIADLKAQIDPLVDAEKKAKDAIDKATGSIIMQGLAADDNIKKTPGMLDKIAHSLGLISDADYNLALDTEKATATYEANIKAGMSVADATKILTNTVDTMRTSVQMASDHAIIPFTSHVGDASDKLSDARDAALNFVKAEDAMHDKTISIFTNYTDNHTQHYGDQSGDANAGNQFGGNIVSPAGGNTGGGNTGGGHGGNYGGNAPSTNAALASAIHNLPGQIARSVRDAMQLR